jgi:hypothetical protein
METKQPGMEAEAMQRIVAIAVFGVATNRMAHISRVDTNLILTACLQLKLYQ